jgi:hypothetical protein
VVRGGDRRMDIDDGHAVDPVHPKLLQKFFTGHTKIARKPPRSDSERRS